MRKLRSESFPWSKHNGAQQVKHLSLLLSLIFSLICSVHWYLHCDVLTCASGSYCLMLTILPQLQQSGEELNPNPVHMDGNQGYRKILLDWFEVYLLPVIMISQAWSIPFHSLPTLSLLQLENTFLFSTERKGSDKKHYRFPWKLAKRSNEISREFYEIDLLWINECFVIWTELWLCTDNTKLLQNCFSKCSATRLQHSLCTRNSTINPVLAQVFLQSH